METKLIEIRDRQTFIPAMATRLGGLSEPDRYLFARAGYGGTFEEQAAYVVLLRLADGSGNSDPYNWGGGDRTMRTAHLWLLEHWEEIESGQVLDVEFILGETKEPKKSEYRQ